MKIKDAAIILLSAGVALGIFSCGGNRGASADTIQAAETPSFAEKADFNADSAYSYVQRQVDFGPRVPNSEAHRRAGDWLMSELKRHGAQVYEQEADLTAFDGTVLHARNIIGQYNPQAPDRVLLLAHWDCRPWADQDPDEANRSKPIDGANDGASGVGVLLEIARLLSANAPQRGVDIAFVDAEDWGKSEDDSSWCLGSGYLAANPFKPGWRPSEVILLDMVGGIGAVFRPEYLSVQNAAWLVDKLWETAAASGYSDRFPREMGGAITDDHQAFIAAGIPAIDIIEFNAGSGFNPRWHTLQDNMEGIDRNTLKAVGQTVTNYILK